MQETNESRDKGALQGAVLVLLQFDVCESIRLEQLRELIGEKPNVAAQREPADAGVCPLSTAARQGTDGDPRTGKW